MTQEIVHRWLVQSLLLLVIQRWSVRFSVFPTIFQILCMVWSFALQDSDDMSCVGHKTNRFHLLRHWWIYDNQQMDDLGQ